MRSPLSLFASCSNRLAPIRFSALLPLVWAGALSGACAPQGNAQSAGDVECPPGQSFDGTYCVVDQNTATKETPLADGAADEPPLRADESGAPEQGTELPGSQEPGGATVPEEGADGAEGGTTAAGAGAAAAAGSEGEQDREGRDEEADEASGFPDKSTAAPVDYAMAAQAGPVMQYFASAHLPAGARPLGAPFAGQFAQGQVLVKKVQLEKGSCTTIVGVALPPITELHLQLVDPEASVQLAVDQTNGPQAVLGSRDDCYVAEDSLSAVLIVTAEEGQGVAAVQVFRK